MPRNPTCLVTKSGTFVISAETVTKELYLWQKTFFSIFLRESRKNALVEGYINEYFFAHEQRKPVKDILFVSKIKQ